MTRKTEAPPPRRRGEPAVPPDPHSGRGADSALEVLRKKRASVPAPMPPTDPKS